MMTITKKSVVEVAPIRRAVERWRRADGRWLRAEEQRQRAQAKAVDAMLDLAAKLYKARKTFRSNKAFGVFLDRNRIALGKNDRSALLKIAKGKITAELILMTNCRTPQHVWSKLSYSGEEHDWQKHWQGMPDYTNEDLSPLQTVYVHLKNINGRAGLAKVLGQKITPKTKAIWFPPQPTESITDKSYVGGEE